MGVGVNSMILHSLAIPIYMLQANMEPVCKRKCIKRNIQSLNHVRWKKWQIQFRFFLYQTMRTVSVVSTDCKRIDKMLQPWGGTTRRRALRTPARRTIRRFVSNWSHQLPFYFFLIWWGNLLKNDWKLEFINPSLSLWHHHA